MAFSTASNPLSSVPRAGQVVIQGDFDGDGDVDVLAYPVGGPMYFQNNGSGVFTSVPYANSPFAGVALADQFWNSESTYVADFDNDGDLDIWDYAGDDHNINVDPVNGNGPGIYLRNNGGIFERLAGNANPLKDVDSFMDFAIHGDFDGDGDEDVLSWMEGGTALEYFQNNGAGSFTAIAYASSPFSGVAVADQFYAARNTHVADFDGDGDLDIWDATGDSGHGGAPVYLQNNGGTYVRLAGAANPLSQVGVTNGLSYSIVGDFDTDGDIDVLGFDAATGTVPEFFQNDGSGHFTKLTYTSSPFAGIAKPFWSLYSTYVADFDHDGDADVWDFIGDSGAIYGQQLGSPPQLSASTPLDNATDVVPSASLVLQFNETIATAGTGSIRIVRTSDDVVVQTIAANSASVTGWNTNTLAIAHAQLADLTDYYVLVDKQAFRDVDGMAFAGIADKTRLNFTTGSSNIAPTATHLTQTVNYTEDPGVSVLLEDIIVTDPDSGDTLTATLTLSTPAAGGLTTGTFGAATSTYNAGTGVWTVTGTLADVNAALAAVAFAPAANWDQGATISTRIRDAAGTGPADGTITLDVTPVNDAPVAVADALSVAEGGTATVLLGGATSVLANDVDADADSLTSILVTGPAYGTLTLNPNGTFSYVHNGSETTTDSFTYKPNDGTTDGNAVTVTITVTPVNDAPVANADSVAVEEGGIATTLTGGATSVLANDTDAEDNVLSATLVAGPAHGSLTLNPNGTFTYHHDGGESTTDSFTYKPNDGTADGNAVTVDIAVTPVNDAPANQVPGAQVVNEDVALIFSAGNANQIQISDPDAGAGSLEITLSVTHGTLTLAGTAGLSFSVGDGAADSILVFTGTQADINTALGTLTYTPAADFSGGAVLSITTSDMGNTGAGGVLSDTDTISITVNPVNDAPTVANAITDKSATQDTAFNFQFALDTFADVDAGATLTYTAQLAGGGALPAWLSFDSATRAFSGTPANGDVGTVSIDVIANDGNGGTVTDTFDIVVANVNDAPTVANAIAGQNATEDAAFNFQFAANTFADVDVGDILAYSAQLAGGDALPTWLSFDAVTRTFSGIPLNGDVGTVSIDVMASDGNGGTVTNTFDIVVANTNDAPTVANAIPNRSATAGTAFHFQLAANTFADVDVGDTLTYSVQLAGGGALPAWLSFDPATRTFSGIPATAHIGTLGIDVIADDGNGGTVTDTFDVVVTAAPVIPPPDPEPPTPNPPTPGVPDNDGIPAEVEDQAPGIPGPDGTTVAGDGNGDGIKDSEQPGVASIGFLFSPTAESNPGSAPPTYTTLVASSQDGKVGSGNENSRILSLAQKDAPPDAPEGMQMPIGLVSFTVELFEGKTGENFSLYLDPALGVNGYWKQDANGTWVNLASEPYGGKMVLEGGRVRLDFHIEDGGQFDADGKADGIITDPGAPAHLPLSITGLAPDLLLDGFWF